MTLSDQTAMMIFVQRMSGARNGDMDQCPEDRECVVWRSLKLFDDSRTKEGTNDRVKLADILCKC